MTINGHTYGSSLLAHLGVGNVYEDDDSSYPVVELDEVIARRPDIAIVPSEPYPFAERHRGELEIVAPLVFVDGRDLFWWGARTAAAAGRLHDVLSRAAEPPPMA